MRSRAVHRPADGVRAFRSIAPTSRTRTTRGASIRERAHRTIDGWELGTSEVLIRRESEGLASIPENVPSCSGTLISYGRTLIEEPEWKEGGEFLYLGSQSPALARAIMGRLPGSTLVALALDDDASIPVRYLVRVGTRYIDAQGIWDRETARRDLTRGLLFDISEEGMFRQLARNRNQDPQNWELADLRVEKVPGLRMS